ncbi:hypothetical protein GALMADRAFT_240494 [Galerina marginata CBS 339.88]|uniref:Actin cytoskeleton-regulatory complex protein PAN1 n=1 Tax=Galerina marginata (strain CBS 339.88) TaxID=685588 RepID=A0A067TQ62_GALM3|nr:hypothetical protein GALMADRAFT_240494 [Galerina marginata CBS 339.88]
MAQWGQGQQGFQYPMQTGFPGANPQFQQNPQFQPQNPQFQPQNPQFQQQVPQFQQGGLGIPNGGGLLPQQTGFPQQRPQGFQQPQQQTGFQAGPGFIPPQQTGFPGSNFQQQARAPPPPVPPIPSQFQQPNQPSFLSMPPQQPNRLLSASPGFGGGGLVPQPTGFPGRSPGPLVPQMTGFVDPRLQMMSQTFMPINTNASGPYGAGGLPQLPQQQQNLVQSIQQHNQAQRGSVNQQMSWALTKAEKKNYDQIFRSWDKGNSGFISGANALEGFGASGLPKDDLARIWTLADINDRGKLNIAEFHVAMGLIYRRINGMPVPDQLPPELIPPSVADLDSTVDRVKELLKSDTRSGSSNKHSFNSASPSPIASRRDASNYKHSDSEPPGGFFKPSNRHVDRSAIRSRNDDSPASDLSDMKRQLENTAQMLDRAAEEDASRTKEDEELDQEMEDLKYRVKRVRDDLDYVGRGPKTSSKEEERRRLERELLTLMHERIPEVERKIKARDERKEREKRQWARDRDRANDRFGRYDSRDDYSRRDDRDRPYSRNGDRDRPYSRGDDRDRPYSRGPDDRRGGYDRDDRGSYRRDRSRSRERDGRDRYDRPRSPPSATRSPAPAPPVPPPAALSPAASIAPASPATPTPSLKNMTPAERQAFAKAEAQRRIQDRMAKLGVTAPSGSPVIDTSVEDRLLQEKKEAEEKTKAAEKQAEERERARKERLANEKALQDDKATPAPPKPTPTRTAAPPAPTPTVKATPKAAPPPPKSRAPAPPPPRKAAAPVRSVASVPAPKPPAPAPAPPSEPEIDPEEEALRAREVKLRKQREEREARMRQLEKEEEEEAARYEQERQARLEALRAKAAKPPTPPPAAPPPPAPVPVIKAPSPPAVRAPPGPASAPAVEKSTNPFSRLLKEGVTTPSSPPTTNGNGNSNPWARPQTAPPPSVPPPSKSPAPKTNYQTVSSAPDDDWDDLHEKSDDDDSSDDEIAQSRSARANIAQQLFGSMLPRPASAAAGSGPSSSPSSPAPFGAAPTPPPPPPSAPPAPRAPAAPAAPTADAAAPGDVNALMRSIQGGMKLRPTKTVDKSAPPVSGKVLGDIAPPSHINTAPRSVSPPPRSPSPPQAYPEPAAMSHDDGGRSTNRQSVGWFADRAADLGTPVDVQRLPSTAEDEEEDMYVPEAPPAPAPPPAPVPQITVDEPAAEPMSDLMADIDKSTEHRVRSLYAYEGDGPEDLSFGENIVIVANPSKSGGDWWYGTTVNDGKFGLFPKNYVEVVTPKKAKAVFTYTGGNLDELSFTEGETLSIVDMSEEEWWKAEQGGVVLIVPAAYLEIVEEGAKGAVKNEPNVPPILIPQLESTSTETATDNLDRSTGDDVDSDSEDSDSDYLSFDESDKEESTTNKEARERERQLVLEAAGLIVNQDVGRPPTRARSIKRRPAPAAPRRQPSVHKDLPPVPGPDPEPEADPETEVISHEARLDDAFARYESFKNTQANLNRLSVVSTDSSVMPPSSPTTTVSSMSMVTSPVHGSQGGEGKYSHFLNFLTRSKTPDGERRSTSTLMISAPIMNVSNSQGGSQEGPTRSNSPSFGMSWASLVDKNALDGIPPGERKRQEAIFELINTEVAYVRDLQLIVEVFYSSMVSLLSTKEITVVFANIEDLLLTNTAFVSSLEERQKDCRLYIDKVGDILLTHIPNMGAYMQYCVNQSTAIKVLQSLRDSNPPLASHLQHLRDENPTTRNLDLSSYLLAPMQRITRYPLLIKQILQYTELGEEFEGIRTARDMAEKLLDHINETIREQEGHETLKKISQNLWIGQGRLDLTAPTRFMGQRRLIKQGVLMKAKSGKKLHAFLCSDILVLVDESMTNLYRMPIPLAHAQVKDAGSKDDTTFSITQPYPRGGDSVALRALSIRDCQQWTNEIGSAGKRARHAEERTARKAGRR